MFHHYIQWIVIHLSPQRHFFGKKNNNIWKRINHFRDIWFKMWPIWFQIDTFLNIWLPLLPPWTYGFRHHCIIWIVRPLLRWWFAAAYECDSIWIAECCSLTSCMCWRMGYNIWYLVTVVTMREGCKNYTWSCAHCSSSSLESDRVKALHEAFNCNKHNARKKIKVTKWQHFWHMNTHINDCYSFCIQFVDFHWNDAHNPHTVLQSLSCGPKCKLHMSQWQKCCHVKYK